MHLRMSFCCFPYAKATWLMEKFRATYFPFFSCLLIFPCILLPLRESVYVFIMLKFQTDFPKMLWVSGQIFQISLREKPFRCATVYSHRVNGIYKSRGNTGVLGGTPGWPAGSKGGGPSLPHQRVWQ